MKKFFVSMALALAVSLFSFNAVAAPIAAKAANFEQKEMLEVEQEVIIIVISCCCTTVIVIIFPCNP